MVFLDRDEILETLNRDQFHTSTPKKQSPTIWNTKNIGRHSRNHVQKLAQRNCIRESDSSLHKLKFDALPVEGREKGGRDDKSRNQRDFRKHGTVQIP